MDPPPPPAVRLPPARGERDHQAAAAHQASAAPSAAAAAAAYPMPRQQQPQQTTQRQQQQQQTTRRLQSTQRSSAQRSSGSSSTSSSSTSSRPPEARLAFVHPLWPQVTMHFLRAAGVDVTSSNCWMCCPSLEVIVDSYCTCADIDARAANPDDGRRWAEGVEDQKCLSVDFLVCAFHVIQAPLISFITGMSH